MLVGGFFFLIKAVLKTSMSCLLNSLLFLLFLSSYLSLFLRPDVCCNSRHGGGKGVKTICCSEEDPAQDICTTQNLCHSMREHLGCLLFSLCKVKYLPRSLSAIVVSSEHRNEQANEDPGPRTRKKKEELPHISESDHLKAAIKWRATTTYHH